MKFGSIQHILLIGLMSVHDMSIAQITNQPRIRDLAGIQINAANSGPRIWRFVKGNTKLLVLGTVQPTPNSLDFDKSGIERTVASSDVILGSEGVVVGEGIGLFRGLTLWPSIRKTKYLEDKMLYEVVAANDYIKWTQMKQIYLSGDNDVERMKPMYAAWKLYEAALKKNDLKSGSVVSDTIRGIARSKNIPTLDARYHLRIEDPKNAVKGFNVMPGDDLNCFRTVISSLEEFVGESPKVAHAWAEADIAALTQSTQAARTITTCWARLTNEAIARQQGIDLDSVQRNTWVKALHDASSKYSTIFTTLPVRELVNSSQSVDAILNEGFHLEETGPSNSPKPSN